MNYGLILVINQEPVSEKVFSSNEERELFISGVKETCLHLREEFLAEHLPSPEVSCVPMEILYTETAYENYFFRRSSHPRNYDGPPIDYGTLKRFYDEAEWEGFAKDTDPPPINWNHPVLKSSSEDPKSNSN